MKWCYIGTIVLLLLCACAGDDAPFERVIIEPAVPDISGTWNGNIGYYRDLLAEPELITKFRLEIIQSGKSIGGSFLMFDGPIAGIPKNNAGTIYNGAFDGEKLRFTIDVWDFDKLREEWINKPRTVSATYDLTTSAPELSGLWLGLFESLRFVVKRNDP